MNIEKSQGCLAAFNVVCGYISTRDLVREHIAFKIRPLAADWEMLKDTGRSSLMYLRYTYPYGNQIVEPDGE